MHEILLVSLDYGVLNVFKGCCQTLTLHCCTFIVSVYYQDMICVVICTVKFFLNYLNIPTVGRVYYLPSCRNKGEP